jgi:hypothetical protein
MVRSDGGVGERSDSLDEDLGLAGRSRRGGEATVTARLGLRRRSGNRGPAWELDATRRCCKWVAWRAVKALDIAMDMAMSARPGRRSRGSRGSKRGLVLGAFHRKGEDMGILYSCCLVGCTACDCATGPTAVDSEAWFVEGLGCRRIVTPRVRPQLLDGNQRADDSAGVF